MSRAGMGREVLRWRGVRLPGRRMRWVTLVFASAVFAVAFLQVWNGWWPGGWIWPALGVFVAVCVVNGWAEAVENRQELERAWRAEQVPRLMPLDHEWLPWCTCDDCQGRPRELR